MGHFLGGHWKEDLASQKPDTAGLIFSYGRSDRKWTMLQSGTHGPQCHLSREKRQMRLHWLSAAFCLGSQARRICSWTNCKEPTGVRRSHWGISQWHTRPRHSPHIASQSTGIKEKNLRREWKGSWEIIPTTWEHRDLTLVPHLSRHQAQRGKTHR